MAAIKATFHTARPVPSRGVVSFVFDVPTEEASAALALLGGFPTGGTSVWVGIAPLKPEATVKPDARERYAKLTEGEQAVARASLLVDDREFITWAQAFARSTMSREGLVMWLRKQCGVQSRKEFATDPDALARFLDLEARFKSERRFGPHAAR